MKIRNNLRCAARKTHVHAHAHTRARTQLFHNKVVNTSTRLFARLSVIYQHDGVISALCKRLVPGDDVLFYVPKS